MNSAQKIAIFKAQCANVKALKNSHKQLKTSINEALKKKKANRAEVLTKSLALVFTAWAEASFSKLIHTPRGFNLTEIALIKSIASRNVVSGWEKCIEMALSRHVSATSGFDSMDKDRLTTAVNDLIKSPSELRNKIAHGQWVQALNGPNTDLNPAATTNLSAISVVKIDMWFECQTKLTIIVEHLIVSPNNAFIRTYRTLMDELEDMYNTRSSWTIASKINKLKPIPSISRV